MSIDLTDSTLFFVKIPILIDAYAGYHELGRFINDLEYCEKFMKIEKIKITNAEVGLQRQQIFLTVHAFCLKDFMDEGNLQ